MTVCECEGSQRDIICENLHTHTEQPLLDTMAYYSICPQHNRLLQRELKRAYK